MLNKNITYNQEIAKIRKRDLKEKARQETQKKERILMKKHFAIESFNVVPFMKQKQEERKEKKERKTRNENKAKKRQEGKTKEYKKRERDREREIQEGGGQKTAKEKQRETLKNKQKMPFF